MSQPLDNEEEWEYEDGPSLFFSKPLSRQNKIDRATVAPLGIIKRVPVSRHGLIQRQDGKHTFQMLSELAYSTVLVDPFPAKVGPPGPRLWIHTDISIEVVLATVSGLPKIHIPDTPFSVGMWHPRLSINV